MLLFKNGDLTSKWFLLFSRKPNSQPKKSCSYSFQDGKVEKLSGLGFDNGCLAEGHTEAAMCVKWWLQKNYLQVLKSVKCLGFFNIKKFIKVETLAASGGIFMLYKPKSFYDLHKCLWFPPQFSAS